MNDNGDYDWASYIRQQQKQRSVVRKSFGVSRDRLNKIQAYAKTRRIVYPEYKDAFDYVHGLYPSVGVKQSVVYYTTKALLNEIGYVGIGGFYDTKARVVCVTGCVSDGEYDEFHVRAEATIDEVLCHELIHYCANFRCPVSNRDVEEEIAYGKSIGYLRSRGRTDDFIISKNMLPYLMSVVDRADVIKHVLIKQYGEEALLGINPSTVDELTRPLWKAIHKQTIISAKALGQKMVNAYGVNEKKDAPVRHKQLIIEDFI